MSIDRKSDVSSRSQVHVAALLKLNELRQKGWQVIEAQTTMTTEGMGQFTGETTYLLEQR